MPAMPTIQPDYETLRNQLQESRRLNRVPATPTREQRIDWAYGNAVIENSAVTVEMVTKAVDEASKSSR